MIVLHPNAEQYNSLNGYVNNISHLQFVKDYTDRWVMGLSVLDQNLKQEKLMTNAKKD